MARFSTEMSVPEPDWPYPVASTACRRMAAYSMRRGFDERDGFAPEASRARKRYAVLERSIQLTDYYSILSRAVADLGSSTAQTRAALFERARQMLLDQIQDAPERWTDAAAQAEVARFDAATDQIEYESAMRL